MASLLNLRSLRWKIAALVALASSSVALAVGILVHQSTYDRVMSLGEGRAYVALDDRVQELRRTGVVPPGEPDPDTLPDELRRQIGPPGMFATWYDDRKPEILWMWGATRVDDQVMAVQIDMGSEMRSLRALDRHIVMASLGVLAIVVPLAALAAELPNRRLRRVAGTARRIADGDLDARTLAGSRAGDEVTEIATAVDSMAVALQQRLLSEQRFTADVAHELRTPLMGLVTAAELLPPGEATDLVRDRVQVLRALVGNLLEISRLDAGAEVADQAPVPLAPMVADCVRRTGLQAELTVAGDPVAFTDPRRLDRIIANLVINAHRHGRPPVEVTVTGTTIVVRDHGPGFPGALLATGPERFRTGAAERGHGHGLGLTIATGQARVIGGRLGFGNASDGGAIATLHLPDA